MAYLVHILFVYNCLFTYQYALGTKVGVKLVGALAISPSDATYVVEWKPALKCVNARLIFFNTDN